MLNPFGGLTSLKIFQGNVFKWVVRRVFMGMPIEVSEVEVSKDVTTDLTLYCPFEEWAQFKPNNNCYYRIRPANPRNEVQFLIGDFERTRDLAVPGFACLEISTFYGINGQSIEELISETFKNIYYDFRKVHCEGKGKKFTELFIETEHLFFSGNGNQFSLGYGVPFALDFSRKLREHMPSCLLKDSWMIGR